MKRENNSDPIWHPFTQMKTAAAPIHIQRAHECMLFDIDGNSYIDAIASWWVNIHGHGHPAIAEAISNQASKLEHIIFAGFTHTPAIELANNLLQILPDNFAKVFFSDDGSTSVEVALKMAIQFWYNKGIHHKRKIIAFENAYHGDTFGGMSVAERNAFNLPFNAYLFEVIHITVPTKENAASVLKTFSEIIQKDDVGIFIFEPLVQGAAGMVMYDEIYLNEMLAIAHQHEVICIADEVMTGFGRTGKNFAIEYLAESVDIICLSKGISGGFLPLGATICTQKMYDPFHSDDSIKTFFHGHSYTANPIACAAANASIQLLIDSSCQMQIQFISNQHDAFALKINGHPKIKSIRKRGTILALEIKTEESTSYFNNLQQKAYQYYLSQGIFLRPLGNIVYVMPPYCITSEELNKVYAVIESSLEIF